MVTVLLHFLFFLSSNDIKDDEILHINYIAEKAFVIKIRFDSSGNNTHEQTHTHTQTWSLITDKNQNV